MPASIHAFPPGPRSLVPGRVFAHLRADPLGFLTDQARRFGDIFSFSGFRQRYVVVAHPDLVREVLLAQADAFWKGPALQNAKGTLGEGLLTAEGESHRRQRLLMTPAFHARHVEAYAAEVLRCTTSLLDQWRTQPPAAPIEIRPAMMRLTLQIAGRALLGTLLDEETELVSRSMEALMANFYRAVVPWGSLLMKLPLASTRRILDAQRDLRALIHRIITTKRLQPNAPDSELRTQNSGLTTQDLLSTLIAATDPESPTPLTDTQLADQAVTILTAGHETTANAMTFTLWLLAKHPQEQQQLRHELAPAFAGAPPAPDIIDRLPRLRWILSESMRLLPPVWTVSRQNQREIRLRQYTLPPKCTVLIPQWVLHRDPRWWPDPLTFRPERWRNPTHPRFAYFPFSTGPRNCIGEAFAWLEMSLALALLIRAFDFSLPPTAPPNLPLAPSITLRPRGPVHLLIQASPGPSSSAP